MQKLLLVYYHSENRATSRIWKVPPNMFFSPIWGENDGVLSMRMQVILDSLFARLGSAPIWGGKKGEFRDWTKRQVKEHDVDKALITNKKQRVLLNGCKWL